MIDKLTPEQEKKIPAYQSKWQEVGFNTQPVNLELAKSCIAKLLAVADMHPAEYVMLDSPLQCQVALNFLARDYSVKDCVKHAKKMTVAQARKKLGVDKLDYYQIGYFYQSGNTNAGYCAFYDFLITEVKPIDEETMKVWEIFKDVTRHSHYYWVTENVVFLCNRPEELHFKGNLLHCVDGPALKYRDGYAIYAIEGVRLPKDFVLQKAEDVDMTQILKETNAEVRMAMMAKVGSDRLIDAPGVETLEYVTGTELYKKYTIGKWRQHGDVTLVRKNYEELSYGDLTPGMKAKLEKMWYKLISVPVGNAKYIYLAMQNPSIDHVHVEGVRPECSSVFEALCFRNNQKTLPFEIS
jgi:hypothetical protein